MAPIYGAVGAVLVAATAAAAAPASPAALPFALPATSPLIRWAGRTVPLPSGGVTFDWSSVSATVVVNNTAFTTLVAVVADGCAGGNKLSVRMSAQGTEGLDVASVYTGGGGGAPTRVTLFSSPGRLTFWGAAAAFTVAKAVEARFTQCAGGQNLTLLGFEADAPFLPAPPATRRLEVVGDSITAGDLVHCVDAAGRRIGVNNSLWADDAASAFGPLLGLWLGADVSVVAWGGMGMAAGDTPSWTWPTMPDVYGSALAWEVDVAGPGAPLAHPWNFSSWAPHAVVVNLGTNDAAGERFNNASFATRFVARYSEFVAGASAAYRGGAPPAAGPVFFLAAGPMTTAYAPAVAAVLANVTAAGIPAHFLNMTLPGGCGCGHPSAADHVALAAAAAPVIKAAMRW
jgi:hypothetical protein